MTGSGDVAIVGGKWPQKASRRKSGKSLSLRRFCLPAWLLPPQTRLFCPGAASGKSKPPGQASGLRSKLIKCASPRPLPESPAVPQIRRLTLTSGPSLGADFAYDAPFDLGGPHGIVNWTALDHHLRRLPVALLPAAERPRWSCRRHRQSTRSVGPATDRRLGVVLGCCVHTWPRHRRVCRDRHERRLRLASSRSSAVRLSVSAACSSTLWR